MSLLDTTEFRVSLKSHNAAKRICSKFSDQNTRRRAYKSLLCMDALADYLYSQGFDIDISKNLYKVLPLNEEFEFTDIHCNGRFINVVPMVNGKYILIPKNQILFDIQPELYVVADYSQTSKKIKFLGCIEKTKLNKTAENGKYYVCDLKNMQPPAYIEELLGSVKDVELSETNHDIFISLFIDYIDGILDDTSKKRLVTHLIECKDCRAELVEFFDYETIVKATKDHPEVLNDNTLDIIGAVAVNDEKYKNYKEYTIEINKEKDEYDEDNEDTERRIKPAIEDPLQILYGKSKNNSIFDIMEGTNKPKKQSKSMLDDIITDINIHQEQKQYPKEKLTQEDLNVPRKGTINPQYYTEDTTIENDKPTEIIRPKEDLNKDEQIYEIIEEDLEDTTTEKLSVSNITKSLKTDADKPQFIEKMAEEQTDKKISVTDELILLDEKENVDKPAFIEDNNISTNTIVEENDDIIVINDNEDNDITDLYQSQQTNKADNTNSAVNISKEDDEDIIIIEDDEEDTTDLLNTLASKNTESPKQSSEESEENISEEDKIIENTEEELLIDDYTNPSITIEDKNSFQEEDLKHFEVNDIDIIDENDAIFKSETVSQNKQTEKSNSKINAEKILETTGKVLTTVATNAIMSKAQDVVGQIENATEIAKNLTEISHNLVNTKANVSKTNDDDDFLIINDENDTEDLFSKPKANGEQENTISNDYSQDEDDDLIILDDNENDTNDLFAPQEKGEGEELDTLALPNDEEDELLLIEDEEDDPLLKELPMIEKKTSRTSLKNNLNAEPNLLPLDSDDDFVLIEDENDLIKEDNGESEDFNFIELEDKELETLEEIEPVTEEEIEEIEDFSLDDSDTEILKEINENSQKDIETSSNATDEDMLIIDDNDDNDDNFEPIQEEDKQNNNTNSISDSQQDDEIQIIDEGKEEGYFVRPASLQNDTDLNFFRPAGASFNNLSESLEMYKQQNISENEDTTEDNTLLALGDEKENSNLLGIESEEEEIEDNEGEDKDKAPEENTNEEEKKSKPVSQLDLILNSLSDKERQEIDNLQSEAPKRQEVIEEIQPIQEEENEDSSKDEENSEEDFSESVETIENSEIENTEEEEDYDDEEIEYEYVDEDGNVIDYDKDSDIEYELVEEEEIIEEEEAKNTEQEEDSETEIEEEIEDNIEESEINEEIETTDSEALNTENKEYDEESESEEEYDENTEIDEDNINQEKEEEEEETKQKNKKKIIIGVVSFIAVAIIAVGAYAFISHSNSRNTEEALNATSTTDVIGGNEDEEEGALTVPNENGQPQTVPADNPTPTIGGEEEGGLSVPESAPTQEQEQTTQTPKPTEPKAGTPQATTEDMNKAVANAFSENPSAIAVSKVAWGVGATLAADTEFKQYLQKFGKIEKATLRKTLTGIKGETPANPIKIVIRMNDDGNLQDIKVFKSSGSQQIDEIVLQSVKQTITACPFPELSENTLNANKKATGGNTVKMTLTVSF